jgi:predicted Zn-dependent protease
LKAETPILMRPYFEELATFLESKTRASEIILSRLSAEDSDFIRFNKSRVRQATGVRQVLWTVTLIEGTRRIDAEITLAGVAAADREALAGLLETLRVGIADVPEDPFLLVETKATSSVAERRGTLPEPGQVIDQVLELGRGLDLVGFHASGPIYKGFSSSLGVRHWHAVENFGFSWCLYHDRDKAVKTSYAGDTWEPAVLEAKMAFAREQLARLGEPPKTLAPGAYRAYLAPAAMTEILGMLNWAGFGLKSRETKQSGLIRMVDGGARFSPMVSIAENSGGGMAAGFQAEGFARPGRVELVRAGVLADPLVSPRSAREFGAATNGANTEEVTESLDLGGGGLPSADALRALGTGLFIGNLWYLNFSDRSACRMTGMTRFASFWVENGRIAAPLNVMRFDDTAFRILGDNLEALTREVELVPDGGTYRERSTETTRTPGALVRDLQLTL